MSEILCGWAASVQPADEIDDRALDAAAKCPKISVAGAIRGRQSRWPFRELAEWTRRKRLMKQEPGQRRAPVDDRRRGGRGRRSGDAPSNVN